VESEWSECYGLSPTEAKKTIATLADSTSALLKRAESAEAALDAAQKILRAPLKPNQDGVECKKSSAPVFKSCDSCAKFSDCPALEIDANRCSGHQSKPDPERIVSQPSDEPTEHTKHLKCHKCGARVSQHHHLKSDDMGKTYYCAGGCPERQAYRPFDFHEADGVEPRAEVEIKIRLKHLELARTAADWGTFRELKNAVRHILDHLESEKP